jgi:GGDEF domain-containing protein
LAHGPQLSIGLSTLAELSHPTAADLLKRADERLYEAKAKRGAPTGAAEPAAA